MPKSWCNFSKVSQASGKRWKGPGSPLKGVAQSIRRKMAATIRKSASPSPPGEPPHTRGGRRSLKKAMRYAVEGAATAVIGPSAEVAGLTGYYHEYGIRQPIRGRRKTYEVGKVGPVDYRAGYATPKGGYRGVADASREGVAFARLKTDRQVSRAVRLDRELWPDVETKVRYKNYPRRPFRQRVVDTLSATVREAMTKSRIDITA